MATPLDGIKVLDLTRVLAGPYATMLLCDLGAEVIKIEQPGTGDESRNFGPFKNGFSLYFMSVNRGKQSITLNLKTQRGREIFMQLVKQCDVVVENFRPGTMQKLGLAYDTLKAAHPSLIYAACSGFGQTGPYAQKGAYDMIIQGMGGIMSITGEPPAADEKRAPGARRHVYQRHHRRALHHNRHSVRAPSPSSNGKRTICRCRHDG